MNRVWLTCYKRISCIVIGLLAYGQFAAAAEVPAFFAYASGGYSVFKSALVQSNDTSSAVTVGFGTYAGDGKRFGMALQREQATFSFTLNNSVITYQLQDLHLRYRYGMFYSGVVFGQSAWQIEAPRDADADGRLDPDGDVLPLVDAIGTGYGANFGLMFETMRRGTIYVDLTYMAAQTALAKAVPQDANNLTTLVEKEATLGARIDFDLGIKFELSRRYLGMAGFRYRSLTLGVDGEAASETNGTTYVGVRYELD